MKHRMKPTLLALLALLALPFLLASSAAHAVDVFGAINTNTTWDQAHGPYHLTGDVTIGNNVTLTILAGTQISAASGDVQKAGTDTNRVELIVNSGATLNISGTQANPVVMTADSGATWYGVEVNSGGTANAAWLNLSSAVSGIWMAGNSTLSNTPTSPPAASASPSTAWSPSSIT